MKSNGMMRILCAAVSVTCMLGVFAGCDIKKAKTLPEEISSENTSAESNAKTTLYAPDGRTVEVTENELPTYIANGWHTTRASYKDTGYYVAFPATDEDLLNFANSVATILEDYKFMFSIGECFNKDVDNPVNGPEHEFGWDNEYLWYGILDEDINTLQDVKNEWRKTFAPSSADEEYFVNFTEINGKVHVAQIMGLGGWMQTTYEFSNVSRVSDTEVHITGLGYIDFDGDGKISGEDGETVAAETFIMVLDNGRWKNKLAVH